MLASPSKNDDLETYVVLADLTSMAFQLYKRTGNEETLKHAIELKEGLDRLKNRIDTHDYTHDDEVFERIHRYNHRHPGSFTSESV